MSASPRSRAFRWAVAIALLVLIGATLLWWGMAGAGGSSATTDPGPTPPAQQAPGLAATTTTSTSSTPEEPAGSDGGGEPTWSTPTSSTQLSAQAAADAVWVRRATDFVMAFARPNSGPAARQWWPRVRVLMSPEAARDYAATDPARVPFTRVTGSGAVLEPDSDVDSEGGVQVGVPTDAGWYLVSFDEAGRVTRIGPVPGPQSAGAEGGQGRQVP